MQDPLTREAILPPEPREGVAGALAPWARAALAGTWLLVTGIHLALPPHERAFVWPLGYLLLALLGSASLLYRAFRTGGAQRTAWGLLALSAFLDVPNLIMSSFAALGSLPGRITGVQSVLGIAGGILVLAGVLSFPRGRDTAGSFRRRALDGLIFAAALLFLLWVLGLQGSLHRAEAGLGLRVVSAYLNVALLGGGLVFMTSYHPDLVRGPFGWLGLSALAWLASLSAWTLAGLPAAPALQPWIVLAGSIPVAQGLAAWSPQRMDRPALAGGPVRAVRLLPYLPVLGALGVMAFLVARASPGLLRGASWIFLAIVVLLVLRQLQTIQDLEASRRTLEDRVLERTLALERAQETLLRTEQLNTLALMGAGLAHDLNNLLGSMRSSAELAALALEEGRTPSPGTLDRIVSTADRAAQLTRRLMGFVRQEQEELSPLDLGPEVRALEATLRLILPAAVDLRVELPEGTTLPVLGSRVRLEQMLVNLVVNARDAMPRGGVLSVRAGLAGPGDGQVLLEVRDTGVGMTPETRERIFELFFTTKAPGRGTGLGLPTLKAMVEETGGRIEVASAPDRGSRFRIYLPRLCNGKASGISGA
jgi:signal transduction histidine kinase